MPAGEDPLERLVGPRLAEDGHVVALESAGVVFHLLHEPLVAILAAQVLHDLLAEGLLLGVQVADRRLDDGPVVADPLPQWVVEREAEQLALFRGDRLVEPGDGGLGGRRGVGPTWPGPAAAAGLPMSGTAAANAPAPIVLTNSRRETGVQNEHCSPVVFRSLISDMGANLLVQGCSSGRARCTTDSRRELSD